jgi:hypothetical protein
MQRLALDQFHHDVELAVGLANFVNGADVGMSEKEEASSQQLRETPNEKAPLFMAKNEASNFLKTFFAKTISSVPLYRWSFRSSPL